MAETTGAGAAQCAAMTMTNLAAIIEKWRRRVWTRRHLRAREAFRLADIGLSETMRQRECAKWFWQK